jgi:hypothetical protein
MVVALNILADRELQRFEVNNHIELIEGLAGYDDLDAARVPVGKPASLGMLAQHVSRFDGERFADPITGHEE